MIEDDHPDISVCRQCELLSISRSVYYYKAREESIYNEEIMRMIDQEYTRHPFYGSRRITVWLNRQDFGVNRKRVQRLMRLMGIEAIYQKPKLSSPTKEDKKYPYLLKGMEITRPNQVWCADITYIPMKRGFMYLMVVMDWYSRYILSYEISGSLESDFCVNALEKSLKDSRPQIFNTDQGTQFTSAVFTNCLKRNDIMISMDGRGRVFDNIFIERFWRSIKYENIYIHDYETVKDLTDGIREYFRFYNTERPHQSFDYRTPEEVYLQMDNDEI